MTLRRRSRAKPAEHAREHGGLAAVVRTRRQELGLTQVELAVLAGVSARFVHAVESGHTEVGLDRLLNVLATLGLHLEVARGERATVAPNTALARQYGLESPDDPGGERR